MMVMSYVNLCCAMLCSCTSNMFESWHLRTSPRTKAYQGTLESQNVSAPALSIHEFSAPSLPRPHESWWWSALTATAYHSVSFSMLQCKVVSHATNLFGVQRCFKNGWRMFFFFLSCSTVSTCVLVARMMISVRIGVTRTSTPAYPSSPSVRARNSFNSALKTPHAPRWCKM